MHFLKEAKVIERDR